MQTSAENSGRFSFGANWQRFLDVVDDDRIDAARGSLRDMLGTAELAGKRFLDIGSGSGLFSLAARQLGAVVHSFDYDEQSVACARELRQRYFSSDDDWTVEHGDALDHEYIASLGQFDIVYSWGVLHHTGDMWTGLGHAANSVADGGQLYIAIYNDQRWLSKYWLKVKRLYNRNSMLRWLVITVHAPIFLTRQLAKSMLTGSWLRRRGMSPWRDIIDWLGGYPFEVARPEAIVEFYLARGLVLERMTTVGGRQGCNEFVLRKTSHRLDE